MCVLLLPATKGCPSSAAVAGCRTAAAQAWLLYALPPAGKMLSASVSCHNFFNFFTSLITQKPTGSTARVKVGLLDVCITSVCMVAPSYQGMLVIRSWCIFCVSCRTVASCQSLLVGQQQWLMPGLLEASPPGCKLLSASFSCRICFTSLVTQMPTGSTACVKVRLHFS
jgi:hypothetical protein